LEQFFLPIRREHFTMPSTVAAAGEVKLFRIEFGVEDLGGCLVACNARWHKLGMTAILSGFDMIDGRYKFID